MGKAAGIWKKIKTVAKTIGNNFGTALNWANENLLRKNKKYLEPLIKSLPGGDTINTIIDKTSDIIHDYNVKKGNKVDTRIGDQLHQGINDAVEIYKADGALNKVKKVNDIVRDRMGLNKTYETTPDDEW